MCDRFKVWRQSSLTRRCNACSDVTNLVDTAQASQAIRKTLQPEMSVQGTENFTLMSPTLRVIMCLLEAFTQSSTPCKPHQLNSVGYSSLGTGQETRAGTVVVRSIWFLCTEVTAEKPTSLLTNNIKFTYRYAARISSSSPLWSC